MRLVSTKGDAMVVFVVTESCFWYIDAEVHSMRTTVDRVFYSFESAEEYILETIRANHLTLSDDQPEDYRYVCNTISKIEGEETHEYKITKKYVCD